MIREKYVEARFGRWFEFGYYPGTDLVDLADTKGDVFCKINRATADKLIRARDKFVDELVEVFGEDPDALYCATKDIR